MISSENTPQSCKMARIARKRRFDASCVSNGVIHPRAHFPTRNFEQNNIAYYRHFWCRGYYVNTAGADTRAIAAYIQNQLAEDQAMEQMTFREYVDPFTGSKTQ